MKHKTTSIYGRLPPDTGTPLFEREVHLSGFRDIKIPSRVNAERKISEFMKFCEKDAKQPAARMLLGSWGEGKTESFYRYIKPQAERHKNNAFLVTSRSIVNGYTHYEGLETSEAKLLLASLFHVLRNNGVSEISYFRKESLNKWLIECLNALDCEDKKLYIFIDEVEQLLHDPQNLRRLMLGIKQILDAQHISNLANGKYLDSIFIFFACTPEAYNRIATDPDVRQVFGGYGRRMDRISITAISLAESIIFIYKLLEYSFDGKLPTPLPISSPGILCTLATIAKRNMGHMVAMAARILSMMEEQNGRLRIIGPNQLKEFAIGRTINIEGHDTKCFENDLYDLILKRLDERELGGEFFQYLFTNLLFDLNPFSIETIVSIFDKEMPKGMENVWLKVFDSTLKSLGYSPAILKFSKFNNQYTEDQLFEELSEFTDYNDEIYQIGERSFTKNHLQDLFLDWSIDPYKNLLKQIALPADIESVKSIFSIKSNEYSKKILQIFNKYSNKNEIVYKLSQDIINQLFPPPCPPGLEFIRDPSERFNLWRKATIEYTELLAKDLPVSLIQIASDKAMEWCFICSDLCDVNANIHSATLEYKIQAPEKKVYIDALIAARAEFTEADIIECEKAFKAESTPVNMFLLISAEPIKRKILKNISTNFRKRICSFNIHPTYIKQILATYWHISNEGAIWKEVLSDTISELLTRDLNFYLTFNKWIERGRKIGFVIDDPIISTGTYRGLVNALRLLYNSSGTEMSLEDLFQWNRKFLRSLIPYGSKTGLIPETDKLEAFDGFRAIIGDLQTNKFLEIESENKPKLKLSPIQKYIIEELSEKEINLKNWKRYIVNLSSSESIVEDLYVESLVQRGFLERKAGRGKSKAKNYRRILKTADTLKLLNSKVEELKNRINHYSSTVENFLYKAHILVAKERDIQVICIHEILQLIDSRMELIRGSKDEDIIKTNSYFLLRILDEVVDPLLISFKSFLKVFQTIPAEMKVKYRELTARAVPEELKSILISHNYIVENEKLNEILEIKKILPIDQFPESINYNYKNEIKAKIDELNIDEIKKYFWFSSLGKEESAHNFYVYKILAAKENFDIKFAKINSIITRNKENLENLISKKDRLYRILMSYTPNIDSLISVKILENLKSKIVSFLDHKESESETRQVNSLKEIELVINSILPDVRSEINSAENSYEFLEMIDEQEQQMSNAYSQVYDTLEKAMGVFDLDQQRESLKEINSFIEEGLNEYKQIIEKGIDVSPRSLKNIKRKLINIEEHYNEIYSLLENELWKPFKELREKMLLKINKCMKTCKSLCELPHDLIDDYEKQINDRKNGETLSEYINNAFCCSVECDKLEKIEIKAMSIIDKYLDKDERELYNSILKYFEDNNQTEGLDLDTFKNYVSPNIKDKLTQLIESLWEKGILALKISI